MVLERLIIQNSPLDLLLLLSVVVKVAAMAALEIRP